ncbi:cilia- and flagella-associated protein 54 isoform X3 [Paramormyrops kingsleyae]|uniref:cilia- and flagella-associated protein 54 isoform X3 n=1 Tax=Paramormyrops kingsleyae TaxID=1676925 RepID=UPI003B97CD34
MTAFAGCSTTVHPRTETSYSTACIAESILTQEGSLHIYNICRNLMSMSHTEQALEFLLWACICLENSIPLLKARFLPWRATLYCAVCQCYCDLQAGSLAEDFARRALDKVSEVAKMEEMLHASASGESCHVIQEATIKLAVMLFKRMVFKPQNNPKGVFRPKQRNVLKDIQITSWPRTSTERLLMDLFDCHAAQLLAVIEALRDTSRRPLQTGPPQDPDDQEVVLELLSAGASILGGIGGSNERVSNDSTSIPAALCGIHLSSSLFEMAKAGKNWVSVDAAVEFVKLLFRYEQWAAFRSLAALLIPVLQGLQKPCFRRAELELVLLVAVDPLISTQKSRNLGRDGHVDRGPGQDWSLGAVVSEDLLAVVETLHSCVCASAQDIQPDRDLAVDVLQLLWAKCKAWLRRGQSGHCLSRLQNQGKWVRVLYILCEVSHSCQLARSDPVAVGEMALRFTAALESRLSSVHQPGRKLAVPKDSSRETRSVDLQNDMVPVPKNDAAEQLRTALEVVERAVESVSWARARFLPRDGTAVSDVRQLQCACHTLPSAGGEEPGSSGKRSSSDCSNITSIHMDLHLELLAVQHRLALKLLNTYPNEMQPTNGKTSSSENLASPGESECERLERIGRNRISKAIFFMQKALLSHRNDTGRSNPKELLQEAMTLIEKAEVEENRLIRMQAAPEPSKAAGGKVKAPPPPILLFRTQQSMIFTPAPYALGTQVCWYRLYGREATGINLKVRLGDSQLPGTGEEVPALRECLLQVQGLQPNRRYVFAVAACDAQGQLVGGAIGETTHPLLASLPLPTLSTWAHLAQVAYQTGINALAKRASRALWEHFTHTPLPPPEPESGSSADRLAQTRLCLGALENASPVLLRLFLTSIFMQTDIHVQERALYCDMLSDGGPLIWGQEARLAECERFLVAIDLALWLEDSGAALQAVVGCYGLLTPFIYHRIQSQAAVQVLIKCLVVLQEIPGELQQRHSAATADSLLHMVACMTYYVTKVLRLSQQYRTASAVVELGRTLLQEAAHAGVSGGPELGPSETPQRDAGSGPTDEEPSKQLRALEACTATSGGVADSGPCDLPSSSSENQNLTGLEEPAQVYSVINSSSLESACREVMKFQQKPDFLELAVHLLQRGVREDQLELVLQWGKELLLWLSRQDEVLTGKKKISKAEMNKYTSSLIPYSKKPKTAVLRTDRKRTEKKQVSIPWTQITGRESQEVKAQLKHAAVLLQQNRRRRHLRQLCLERGPWRCQLNLSLALAHITLLRRSLERGCGPRPWHRYSHLDSISFSLAHVGTLLKWRNRPPSHQPLRFPPLPLRAVPQASRRKPRPNAGARGGSEEEPNHAGVGTPPLPSQMTYDGGERSGLSEPPESLMKAAMHFRRAMVLAHRGGLWTSLQWTCQVLWDQAVIVTQLVERGPSQDQPAPLSLDQLYSVLSPLLVLATDLLLDMMVKLQLWKAFEEEEDEMETSLHFSSPVDDGTLVDFHWMKTLTLHTLQLLFFRGKWETLAHLALLFSSVTRERYTHIVTPLLVHAQWQLLERVEQFGGPSAPQPHFTRTERITGEKVTCRNYTWKQLLSGGTAVAKATPSTSELHRALMLVSVPLDVENSLCCFREMVGLTSYALRSFRHSRELLLLALAGTQPDMDAPFCGKGQSQGRVEFRAAADATATAGPPDVSSEDFSTLASVCSCPLGPAELHTIISSYNSSIKYLQANRLNSLSVLALHDLGDLQFFRGNKRAALACWSKALDGALQSSGVLGSWDGVSWSGVSPQDVLRQAGVWGCLQGAILSAKISQYLMTSDLSQRTHCCLLSVLLFKRLLGASLPHPQHDWQYSTYVPGQELIPGLELFSEPGRAHLSTAVASLAFLSHWLYGCGHFLAALPILCLFLHLVGSVCRDSRRTVSGRVLKVQVLTELSMFSAAVKELVGLVRGENIPQPHGSFIAVEKQEVMNFDDSKPLLEPCNLQAVEELVNRGMSSDISLLFGPKLTRRLCLAKAQLILALCSSIHSLPEVLGEGDVSTCGLRTSPVSDQDNSGQEDTSAKEPHGLQLDQEGEKLTPGIVKALLLREAKGILTSLPANEDMLMVDVQELEMAIETRLLLSALSLQQGRASLSADWAVSALRLLQDSPLLEEKSPATTHRPRSSVQQDSRWLPDPYDVPEAVEARERMGVLWQHCRLAAVRALAAHIPGAAIHPGVDSSAEAARLLEEGIQEAKAWGDPDSRAVLLLQGALLDTHRGRAKEDSLSLLQEAVRLLSGRSSLSLRSSLTLAGASLQLGDLRGVGSRTLYLLVQKLLQKQLSALGESISLREGGQVLLPSKLGMRNIYLPQLPLLAKATMRLGQSLLLEVANSASADHSQWESAQNLLDSAVVLSRVSASRDRELEANSLYSRGLAESRLAVLGQRQPQGAVDTFLEAIAITQARGHSLRLTRRCYLEMALLYLWQWQVTPPQEEPDSDTAPTAREKQQEAPQSTGPPPLPTAQTPEDLQGLCCWTCVRAACQVSKSLACPVQLHGVTSGHLQATALKLLPAFVSDDLLCPCGGFGEPAGTSPGPLPLTWVHLAHYHARLANLHHTAAHPVTSEYLEDLCSIAMDTSLALKLAQLHSFLSIFLLSYRGQCCAPEAPTALLMSSAAHAKPQLAPLEDVALGPVQLPCWAGAEDKQLCMQWVQPALDWSLQNQNLTLLIFAFSMAPISAPAPAASVVSGLRCGQLRVCQDGLEAIHTRLRSLCATVNMSPSAPLSSLVTPTPKLEREHKARTQDKRAAPDSHMLELQEEITGCLLQIQSLLKPSSDPAVITVVPFEPSRQSLGDLERCFNPRGGAVVSSEVASWLASLLL